MTRNTWAEGESFSVAALNALKHAFEGEGIKSGGEFSTGDGDWDVDITAVEYHIGDAGYAAGADTLAVSTPDAEDRLDLITADTNEALHVIEGDPASEAGKPNAEPIPEDEVLLGAVYIREGSSELIPADLLDMYKVAVQVVENWPTDGAEGTIPISQGDGTVAMQSPDAIIPTNTIIWWYGDINDPPTGWAVCDGSDGTPDLIGRFVVAAGDEYELGDTGGENEHQLTEGETPAHTHEGQGSLTADENHVHGSGDLSATNVDDHSHTYDRASASVAGSDWAEGDDAGVVQTGNQTSTDGGQSISISGNTGTVDTGFGQPDEIAVEGETSSFGGDEAHENRPPYYALVPLMRL